MVKIWDFVRDDCGTLMSQKLKISQFFNGFLCFVILDGSVCLFNV